MANLAAACDAAGNAGESATVAVNVAIAVTTVARDTTPPTAAVGNPVAGTVSGNVVVAIGASDDAGAGGIATVPAIDGRTKA
ncbi:hypothetical protein [Massilia putida]|uniref:hypothetical protein n=1 Tax=Massilia putida TaxID=1141883 RepID=UPI000951B37E|nr:hypothetical protein [Massilia putida]